MSQRWTQPGTPSDKLEAHIHKHTHTQTHTDSLHTGTGIHGNPHIRPCQAGTDASSLPRYPHGLFYKGSSRGPGLADIHPETLVETRSHVHTSRATSTEHSHVRPVAFADGGQKRTNPSAQTCTHTGCDISPTETQEILVRVSLELIFSSCRRLPSTRWLGTVRSMVEA